MIWLLRRQTKAHARTRVHNILGVSYFSVAYLYVKAKNTLIKIKNYERTTFKFYWSMLMRVSITGKMTLES